MSILFGLLLARRFYCRSALSLSPGRTGGLLSRINAPIICTPKVRHFWRCILLWTKQEEKTKGIVQNSK